MKILLISTPIFPIPLQAYGGLEQLVYLWAVEFQKAGHQVAVVAPVGSVLPEGMELISFPLRCSEEMAYQKYKDRLGEFDAVFDNTWQWYSILSQMESGKQLPIVHCWHTDPNPLGPPPPIQFPCVVAFSESQANIMRAKWRTAVRTVYHGIDLDFYKPNPAVERTNRYLFLARYTPEKGFLDIALAIRKTRVPLDAYGNTTIVSDAGYVQKCVDMNDGRSLFVHGEIAREETVNQYRTHKALITWPNYIEIFGLTTIEAMACGCPVISKDSGAARELIVNGKTGFVVQSLEELEDLITSDAVSKIKPEDCVKQAAKFSIQKSAQKHLRVFEDMANSHIYW